MNNERLEKLLWERLDGTISGEDLAELEAVLAEHPEPRELEREIARLAGELDELEQVPSPPELRNRISQALEKTEPGGSRRVVTLPVVSSSWARQWLPIAASVVFGVAIGYLLRPGSGAEVDVSRISGAMHPTAATSSSPAFEIDLGKGVGTVIANTTGSTVVIETILTGEHQTLLIAEAANGGLRLLESSQFQNSSSRLWVAAEIFSFSGTGPGTHRFSICATETTAVTITVRIDGALIATRTVGLEVEPEGP